MTGVELRDVSFRYPTSAGNVLKSVTLQCRPGQITWLYGPLGAGASTVLLLAAGLAPRHTGGTMTGAVSVLGHPLDAAGLSPLLGQIGFVTATPHLQMSGIAATVWEEVAFAPANLGWPLARIEQAVEDAMTALGVAHLAGREPDTLSGGELQRTVIASMAVLEPAVWLLDEPTTALDAAGQTDAYRMFRRAARDGATVVVASEQADALADVVDRLIVLRDGEVVLDGDPMSLLAGDDIWEGGPGSTSVAGLCRDASRHVDSPRLAMPYPVTIAHALERWG